MLQCTTFVVNSHGASRLDVRAIFVLMLNNNNYVTLLCFWGGKLNNLTLFINLDN